MAAILSLVLAYMFLAYAVVGLIFLLLEASGVKVKHKTRVRASPTTTSPAVIKWLMRSTRSAVEILECIAWQGSSCFWAHEESGQMLLHFAVRSRRGDVIKLLISKGCKVDAEDKTDMTPFYLACSRGDWAIAEILHGFGANLNHPVELPGEDDGSRTPLDLAVMQGSRARMVWLIRKGAETTASALLWAIDKQDLELLEMLEPFRLSFTFRPLLCAAANGKVKVVDWLLAKCGQRLSSWEQRAAVFAALYSGQQRILRMIMNGGWRPRDDDKWSLLMWAVQSGDFAFTKYLLLTAGLNPHGLIPKTTYRPETTLLHEACASGSMEIVAMLLEFGLDPAAKDAAGRIPLALVRAMQVNNPVLVHHYMRVSKIDGADGGDLTTDWREWLRHELWKAPQSAMWGQYQNFVREELPRLKVHDCLHAISRQTWRPKERPRTTAGWFRDSRLYQMAKKRTASLVCKLGDCIAFTGQAATRKKLIADAEAAVTLAYKNLNMSKVVDAAQGTVRTQPGQRWGLPVPVSRLLNLRMEESGTQSSVTGGAERAGGHALNESGAMPLRCPISSVLMTDPVVADDGQTYQRDAIKAWILNAQKKGRALVSPQTAKAMEPFIAPDPHMRRLVQQYLAAR